MLADSVEQEILAAIERGEFDDLPGSGEPLQLSEPSELAPGWRLAFHVLRNGGFAPAWLERQKVLRAEIERERRRLRLTLANESCVEWERAIESFRTESRRLNRVIAACNLEVPTTALHLPQLLTETEISAARKAAETKDQPYGRS